MVHNIENDNRLWHNLIFQNLGQTKYRLSRFIDRKVKSGLYFNLDRLFQSRALNSSTSVVVIAGFWRSGTTWTQQSVNTLLDANSIFEPFAPRVETYVRDVVPTFWPDRESLQAYHMPFCATSFRDHHSVLLDYLTSCFTAQVPGAWVRTLRDRPDRSLRNVMTVKFVRAQLCLHAIYQEFGFPILYITRDPRAAIASCLRDQWGHFFQHPFLQSVLLECTDGRREYFQAYTDEILRYDAEDPVARLAFFWSVLEQFVRSHLDDFGRDIFCLKYEEVLNSDYTAIGTFLSSQGFHVGNPHQKSLFNTDSKMTQFARKGINSQQRQSSWKQELSRSEIDCIESIVCRFDLEEYLAD